MNLTNQRRLAAEILGVGQNRIWIDPEKTSDVEIAITRAEIRKLIDDKVIKAQALVSTSRYRARLLSAKKKKGRRIGPGTKKGKKNSVISEKTIWMNRIRSLRKKLVDMREKRIITVNTYRTLYRKAKGGEFRSIAELDRYINEQRLRRRSFG
ncbi:50S ribosomal protein L19e [Candidatus Bathyarchaeota archaeon]|nr:50S ribosomal protein L19e [Candidatus Bathyarchaeota archaeon]